MFEAAHQRRFGFVQPGTPVEIVRITARAELPGKPLPPWSPPAAAHRTPRAQTRRPPLGGTAVRWLRREDLPIGARIHGPCVIEEATAATLVPTGWTATVDQFALRLQSRLH
jgi:N-methylhydantoinase A